MTMKCSEAQGLSREAKSEGSVEQIRELTNRNRIQGNRIWASEQVIAKPTVIKRYGCRSGSCAEKVVELTLGGLHCVLETRLRELRGNQTAMQKSAEGIVTFPVEQAPMGKQQTTEVKA